MIKKGDYVLITDKTDVHYLDIGEVEKVEHYPDSNAVRAYHVHFSVVKQFKSDVAYDHNLIGKCRVLAFR